MKILTLNFRSKEDLVDNSWLERKKSDVDNNTAINNIKIAFDQQQFKLVINDFEHEIENGKIITTDYCSIEMTVEEKSIHFIPKAHLSSNYSKEDLSRSQKGNSGQLTYSSASTFLPHPVVIQNKLDFLYKGFLPLAHISASSTNEQFLKDNSMINQDINDQVELDVQDKIIDNYLLYLFIKNIKKLKKILGTSKHSYKKYASIFSLLSTLALISCQSLPSNVIQLSLSAADDINPDVYNKASPVVIIFYQLKDKSKFEKANYFELYNHADVLLKSNLLNQQEYEIRPGENILQDLEFFPESRYLGIMVAFRDFERAEWKEIVNLNTNQLKELQLYLKNLNVTVKF